MTPRFSFLTLNRASLFLFFCVFLCFGKRRFLRCGEFELGRMRVIPCLCFSVLIFWILFLQVFSAPMGQIFDRLQAFGEFEVGES